MLFRNTEDFDSNSTLVEDSIDKLQKNFKKKSFLLVKTSIVFTAHPDQEVLLAAMTGVGVGAWV